MYLYLIYFYVCAEGGFALRTDGVLVQLRGKAQPKVHISRKQMAKNCSFYGPMHLENSSVYTFVILKPYCRSVEVLVLFGLLALNMKAKREFKI